MGVNAETGALGGPLKILQENGETWNNYLLLTPGVHMRECVSVLKEAFLKFLVLLRLNKLFSE